MNSTLHLSTLDLDRLLLAASSHPHLERCGACQTRLHSLRETQAELVIDRGLRRLEAQKTRVSKRWAWLFAPGFAAAAALVLLLQTPPDDLTVKGDAVASLYVYRGDSWQPVQKGQTLKAGEGVRVQMHLRGAEAYGLILESSGNALLPFKGQAAAPLQKSATDALFVLDDARGDERWLVLVSTAQITTEQAKPALATLESCPKEARCSWIEFSKESK